MFSSCTKRLSDFIPIKNGKLGSLLKISNVHVDSLFFSFNLKICISFAELSGRVTYNKKNHKPGFNLLVYIFKITVPGVFQD